jgi:hypothetical protein
MRSRGALFFLAIVLIVLMTILMSFSILPAAPVAPTPTWPLGIDLPNKLPRIPG